MNRDFFIALATARSGDDVQIAIVGQKYGEPDQVRDQILLDPKFPPGSYLLLEKNVPIVTKRVQP